MIETKQYILGKGEVYFAKFEPGTQIAKHWVYMGNTPEFNMTVESEELAHMNSDAGIREEDDSVTLETTRSATLMTDNINAHNVALFFLGEASKITQTTVAEADETITDVRLGNTYFIGVNDTTNIAGYMGINPTGFEIVQGATPLVAGVDFEMDFDRGALTILATSTVVEEGDDIVVTRAVRAQTYTQVISGNTQVEGAIRFLSKNPKGPDSVILVPWVKISPNGDYALKGDDWQQLPYNVRILKREGKAAIYRNGLPDYTA